MALADTRDTAEIFRAGSVDAMVTDAPYGVQHGSRAEPAACTAVRSSCWPRLCPGWVRVLRPGGAVGIAVNIHTCPRDDALALLADAGLEPRDDPAYRGFEHRVDQAIHARRRGRREAARPVDVD